MLSDPTDLLAAVLDREAGGFVELRYHKKRSRALSVEKGRVDQARSSEHSGVGVRVLEQGTWGFASTDRFEQGAVARAIDSARRAARSSSAGRKQQVAELPSVELARGLFEEPGYSELEARPLEQSLELILGLERQTRAASKLIQTATCHYGEDFEEKGIVTSDGAKAWTRLVRPVFYVTAVAQERGEIQRGMEAVGATGAWDCLFGKVDGSALAERAARGAVDLLHAGHPEGGRRRVLLSPGIVGLLTHEAVGHTVEADFVRSGSCAAGRLGQRVASELVTLCDSGVSEYARGAGGTLRVDDEGVPCGRTTIIREGRLESYLHDRQSAAHYGVAPTGNARAWEYDNEPLIRMRNTYIAAGDSTLEELIDGMQDGLILDGPRNGQADANGEFMFGTARAWPVKGGQRGELMRGVNISGIAFEVLATVSGVGKDFQWDMGAGHCGKGQPARVDAGGPWLCCEVLVGGRQS